MVVWVWRMARGAPMAARAVAREHLGRSWGLLAAASASAARRWSWPDRRSAGAVGVTAGEEGGGERRALSPRPSIFLTIVRKDDEEGEGEARSAALALMFRT